MSTLRVRRFTVTGLAVAAVAGFILAIAAACSSGGGQGSPEACTPGASVACVCPSGAAGAQSCGADGGGYGTCVCTGASSRATSVTVGRSSTGPFGTSHPSGTLSSGTTTTTTSGAPSGVDSGAVAQCILAATPVTLSDESSDAGKRLACGPANVGVACGAGSCPQNSECSGGVGCPCDPGYTPYTCAGEPCSGAACPQDGWWCVPVATCGIEYSPDQSEALYVYNSGPTFVAVRMKPATGGALAGSYTPVPWTGKNPFTPPTDVGGVPTSASVKTPIDWSGDTVAPMCLAYWIMDTRGGKVKNYVSRVGGAKVKISLPVADGGGPGGFELTIDDPADGGSDAADLEAVTVDDAGAVTSDGGAPVFVAATAIASVSRSSPSSAQCGSGGATCTSFTTCDPFAADAGCGCDTLKCAGTDPSSGANVCCTTLGNACSSASECCGGDVCADGVCQLATTSLCTDAGAPVDSGSGGVDGGLTWCCIMITNASSWTPFCGSTPTACECQQFPAGTDCTTEASLGGAWDFIPGGTVVPDCNGEGCCGVGTTASGVGDCLCQAGCTASQCSATGIGFPSGTVSGSTTASCPP